MIALGVIAGVWLFGRRLEQKGIGTREDANAIGLWGVVAGVIGARLYHVLTDWERFEDNLGDIVKIWEGGLGIPGGMLAGVLVGGVRRPRKRGIPLGAGPQRRRAGAAAGPGDRALGQLLQPGAVRPADRPAVGAGDRRRAPRRRLPAAGRRSTRRSSTSRCGTSRLCGLLLWIDKRYRPAGGRLLAMYVLGYGVGRFWVEGLRIDEADELGGLRWNQWVVDRPASSAAGSTCWRRSTSRRIPVLPPIVHGAPGRRRHAMSLPRPVRTTTTSRHADDRGGRATLAADDEAEVDEEPIADDAVDGDDGRPSRRGRAGRRRARRLTSAGRRSDLVDHAERRARPPPSTTSRRRARARPGRPASRWPRRACAASRVRSARSSSLWRATSAAVPSTARLGSAQRSEIVALGVGPTAARAGGEHGGRRAARPGRCTSC